MAFPASSTPISTNPSLLPTKAIYQFPNLGDWAENIAVRPNGDLLVTLLGLEPQLWQIPQPWTDAPAAALVHTFPSDLYGLVGIAETRPDVFVLAGISLTDPSISSVWEVIFEGDGGNATTRKIADVPGAVVLNGVAAVPSCSTSPAVVLIADSMAGLVWRVDTWTGAVSTGVQVPQMAPLGNATSAQNIGINGIKIRDGYLYFDNSYAAAVYRVQIDGDGFVAAGAVVETVAVISDETFLDDFVFDASGNIYIASSHGNTVRRVDVATGESVLVAGAPDQQTLLGDTAAALGRTDKDRGVLYVTTSGYNYSNSTAVEPGKVVAVDVTRSSR
ncbi:hypothetical protein LQW54_009209 [Pestalotiopsis sp. IQ-011]